MNVASILNRKGNNVINAKIEMTLLEVSALLSEYNIGSVVVTDDDGTLCGIISERDIVRAIAKSGSDVLQKQVAHSMTKNVVTCIRADSIDQVMTVMTGHRFRHMPVVENGELIGLISIGDVVKHRIAEAEMEADAMRQYISTG